MPNIVGYSETDKPDWIQVQFDDGSSTHVQDPAGSYRKEVDDVATKLGFKQAVSGLAGVAPPMPLTAPVTPAEALPLQVSAADRAILSGQAPPPPVGTPMQTMEQPFGAPANAITPMPAGLDEASKHPMVPMGGSPPGSLVSDAERASLSADPADLAGIRRGLGETARAPAAPAIPPAQPARSPYGGKPPMGMSGASVATTGLTAEDRARVDAARGTAIDDNTAAKETELEATTRRVNEQFQSLTEDAKTKLAEQAALKLQEDAFTQKIADNHQRLEADLSRKVDPGETFKGDAQYYAFMAGFGDALQNFGAALAGRGPVANPGETISRMVNRNVQMQTEQKEADFRKGRITGDQLVAERELIRAKQLTVAKQLTDNMLAKEKNADRRAQLSAADEFIVAERSDAIAKSAEASAQHEQRQEQFSPVKLGGPPSNATIEALKLLGVTPEQYSKGMASMVGTGELAPTVNETVVALGEMTQDMATLKALAAANGGTIPTRGVFNVPETLRPALARMGIKSGISAEEANQLMHGYVVRKARSYGGAVTAPDFENAEKEFGKTGDAFIRGISRMRAGANKRLSQNIDTIFPGVGQNVLDLSLRRTAQTPGIPEAEGIEDFEVQSAEQKAQNVSVTRESPEGKARRLAREQKHLEDKPDPWKNYRGVEPVGESTDEDGNPIIDLDELEQHVGR